MGKTAYRNLYQHPPFFELAEKKTQSEADV